MAALMITITITIINKPSQNPNMLHEYVLIQVCFDL